MKAYRAALLRFDDQGLPLYDSDGLLVIGPDATGRRVVRAAGSHDALIDRFAGVTVEDLRGHLIAPGFVDLHVHYPQTDVIGAPAAGLLPWLENYTFPHESRFADKAYARGVADFFLDELARHGVTTALTFATSHPGSVDAAFEAEIGIEHQDPLASFGHGCSQVGGYKCFTDAAFTAGNRDDFARWLRRQPGVALGRMGWV